MALKWYNSHISDWSKFKKLFVKEEKSFNYIENI